MPKPLFPSLLRLLSGLASPPMFRRMTFLAALLLVLLGATACTSQSETTAANAASANIKAFTGARVWDGTGSPVIDNAVILVRDGKVEAVGPSSSVHPPEGAQVTNLAGKYVIPGMISAHVHIDSRCCTASGTDVQGKSQQDYGLQDTLRQLGVFARYGFTTVYSLGGEQAPAFTARDQQNTPSLDRARLYLSGTIINSKTPAEAREMVAKVAETKPDIFKIRVGGGPGSMPPAVYRTIIDEAHKRGIRVAAHIYYLDDAKDLLRSGVDMIAHSVRDKAIDDEFISLMKVRNIPYCATLTRDLSVFVYETKPAFFSDPFFLKEADKGAVSQLLEPARQQEMAKSKEAQTIKKALEVAKMNLKKASDAGLLIAMGTDSGASASRFQGYFEHLEMEMMADLGMTPEQILRSATGEAARAMKSEGVGTIAKGNWADFVVLDRNPLTDIKNTRSISSVWIAGNQVKQ